MKRIIVAIGLLCLIFTSVIYILNIWNGLESLPMLTSSTFGEVDLSQRMEIWSRAIYCIQDFSITGMGLGTFRKLAFALYPFFLIGPEKDIAHAHNYFIQTALDMGIPGLISILSVFLIIFYILSSDIYKSRANDKTMGGKYHEIAIGFIGGVLAYFIYSLTDAIAMGARPGFILWMVFGLIISINPMKHDGEHNRIKLGTGK